MSISPFGKRGFYPSVQRRYIERARSLQQGNPDIFRDLFQQHRASWNTDHPDVPISSGRAFNWDPAQVSDSFLFMPEVLLEKDKDGFLSTRWTFDRFEWQDFVDEICRSIWPPRFYPRYGEHHPAMAYVSACLVYHERTVPIELIKGGEFVPTRQYYDPDNPVDWDRYRLVEAENAALHRVIEGLLDDSLVDFMDTDPPADVARIVKQSAIESEIKAAREDALLEGIRLRSDLEVGRRKPFLYVTLPPGLTTADWDDLRPRAITEVNEQYGGDPIVEWVTSLVDSGMSSPEIASLLGVSLSTVTRARSATNGGT
ncbi:MAG: hypothetical protein WBA63_04835 [Thermomicrobiales bacterium]